MRCALGRGGVIAAVDKREGDGDSPLGVWPIRRVLYRPDRAAPPRTALPVQPIAPDDGWCDAPAIRPTTARSSAPTRPAARPCGARTASTIWSWCWDTTTPRRSPGLGSAIFLHLAGPDYAPTDGCVALSRPDLEAAAGPGRPRRRGRDRALSSGRMRGAAPNSAEPTRTEVAPKAIAVSKSPLIPIDRRLQAVAAAILARSAKCGAGGSSCGRHAHQPLDGSRPKSLAAFGDEGVRLAGRDPGLLRLLAGVDLDIEPRRAAGALDLLGQHPGELRPVQALDHVEEARPPRAPCWSAAGRSGARSGPRADRSSAPAPPAPGSRRTPFGPPAAPARYVSHGCCLETATRVTSAGSRPAAMAAAAMRARMASSGGCVIRSGHRGDMDVQAEAGRSCSRPPAAPRRKPASRLPSLWLITDPARTPDPAAAAPGLPRGAGVIYRGFGAAEALGHRPARCAGWRRRAAWSCWSAPTPRLAAAVRGRRRASARTGDAARDRRCAAPIPRWRITAAAHDRRAIVRARRLGLDGWWSRRCSPAAAPRPARRWARSASPP